MAKLFIVGFPRDMEEIELVEMFSVYGTVNTVTIVTDKNTGESKGYGFITMTDQTAADRAIAAMDGAEIDDRKISVRIAEDKNVDTSKPDKVYKKPYQSGPSVTSTRDVPAEKKKRPRKRL